MDSSSTPAKGATDLDQLIRSMSPHLDPQAYVFAICPSGTNPLPSNVHIQMMFNEVEGTTLIVSENYANEHGLKFSFACRKITLEIHSSLEAVGFLAVVTRELAQSGIPTNTVSAYFHDHLFVPVGREIEAMDVLKTLSTRGDPAYESGQK